ncbi:MAG: histidinol-phosphate transaminase [Deltaproteobacteria bacterium]|nr:histidinol-phosphate transaminase [Deltaproteobacteria bacterium]
MKIRDLVNPHVRDLAPYVPGKPVEELERELGIEGSIKLASNESPLGPSRRVIEAIFAAAEELNRYPDDSCFRLRAALATKLGVGGDSLCLAAGSDGILELLAKCFLGPGDQCVFPWPSFAMYPIATQGAGASAVRVPLDAELRADVGATLAAVGPRTRLVFLANPNNPTGTSLGAADFARLVKELPERVVLVADEAYVEFVRRSDFPDAIAALRERPTLVVLRTFSKAYALAGLRVGYAVGHPELIAYLERARHPFIVSSLAQVAACAALADGEHLDRIRAVTHAGLAQLEAGLRALGLRFAASDANFICVEVGPGADALNDRLLRSGVITRPLGGFGLTTHLRVSVGTERENERFLATLARELRN